MRSLRALAAMIVAAFLATGTGALAQTVTPYGTIANAGGVALGVGGEVFAVDRNTGIVYRVAPGGATTQYGQAVGNDAYGVARAGDGTLYVVREFFDAVYRFDAGCATPCAPTLMATDARPFATAVDSAGNLYVGSFIQGEIRRYAAGCAAPCTATVFATGLPQVSGLAFDAAGDLFAAQAGGAIQRFAAGCVAPCSPTTYASGLATGLRGLVIGEAGSLYYVNRLTDQLLRVPAGGGVGTATVVTTYPAWDFPTDIDRDPATGVLYVASIGAPTGLFAVAPPPPAIPTLSEWALILLGVMLAGGAAVLAQRRLTV